MALDLKIGERYGYTYPEYRFRDENRIGDQERVIPPTTVYFTVTGVENGIYHILYENGSRNKFEKTSQMHEGVFSAPLADYDLISKCGGGDQEYPWTVEEAIAAIENGIAHYFFVFKTGIVVVRYHDEDYGKKIAAETLKTHYS